jgi:hypothetical protein
MGYRQGSRTVPIALAKMQVNRSVDLGSYNTNHFATVIGPTVGLQ